MEREAQYFHDPFPTQKRHKRQSDIAGKLETLLWFWNSIFGGSFIQGSGVVTTCLTTNCRVRSPMDLLVLVRVRDCKCPVLPDRSPDEWLLVSVIPGMIYHGILYYHSLIEDDLPSQHGL